MRVLVLYRPNSAHGRMVEEFINDFQRQHDGIHLEIVDVDSREGSAVATLYDVMQYPAILVLQSDGQLQKSWQGDSLPLMQEITAYASA